MDRIAITPESVILKEFKAKERMTIRSNLVREMLKHLKNHECNRCTELFNRLYLVAIGQGIEPFENRH